MKGFLIGLVLIPVMVVSILSIRPGGLRRQLKHAGRRFRLVLVLAGIYLLGSTLIRVAFPHSRLGEYGPAALAVVLAGVFVVLGQDRDLPVES